MSKIIRRRPHLALQLFTFCILTTFLNAKEVSDKIRTLREEWTTSIQTQVKPIYDRHEKSLKKIRTRLIKRQKEKELVSLEQDLEALKEARQSLPRVPTWKKKSKDLQIQFARKIYTKKLNKLLTTENQECLNKLDKIRRSMATKMNDEDHLLVENLINEIEKTVNPMREELRNKSFAAGVKPMSESELAKALVGTRWSMFSTVHKKMQEDLYFKNDTFANIPRKWSDYAKWEVTAKNKITLIHIHDHWQLIVHFADDFQSFKVYQMGRNLVFEGKYKGIDEIKSNIQAR